jgi:hypothetical protein
MVSAFHTSNMQSTSDSSVDLGQIVESDEVTPVELQLGDVNSPILNLL